MNKMEIIFSEHAEQKIAQRRLSREKIFSTVAHPDFRRMSHSLREELYKKFEKNYLKVVIAGDSGHIVVVTAHWVADVPDMT